MFKKDTNILVVDDSVNIRNIIFTNLKQVGFTRLEAAGDANEAMAALTRAENNDLEFGLILSDLNMPGPSGLDFLKYVRSIDKYKSLPFVLVTTESEKGSVIEAAMQGVSGYIVKPFNVDTLTKRLMEVWKKHNP